MDVLFYIHGNIVLNGPWSEDLRCAVETLCMTDGVRKVLGRDAIIGNRNSLTYIIMGHGSLVLSDVFDAFDFLFDKYQATHPRTCENLLKEMQSENLSVEFKTSQHDMHVFLPDNCYNIDGHISSDGCRPVLSFSVGANNHVCDSLYGYGLTRLCELSLKSIFDMQFDDMDCHMRAASRCMLYFNLTDRDFFDMLLHIMRQFEMRDFYAELDKYLEVFIKSNRAKIRNEFENILVGVCKS